MDDSIWCAVCRKNFLGNGQKTGIPRDITAKALSLMGGPEATYFYGPRRAGKTTVCYQLISALSKKYGAHSCLYVNFEEPAFIGHLSPGLISDIVDRHAQEFKKPPKYVFLDEAQNVSGWEKWVRSEVDAKEIKIVVTGSSAKLLSSEFATSLGGRGIGFLRRLRDVRRDLRVAVPARGATSQDRRGREARQPRRSIPASDHRREPPHRTGLEV